jgi:hypothetical protein
MQWADDGSALCDHVGTRTRGAPLLRLRHLSTLAAVAVAAALLTGCAPGAQVDPTTCAGYAELAPADRSAIAEKAITGDPPIIVFTDEGADGFQLRQALDMACDDNETIADAAEYLNGLEPAQCAEFLQLDETAQTEWADAQWDTVGGSPFSSVKTERDLVAHMCGQTADATLAEAVGSMVGMSDSELLAMIGVVVDTPEAPASAAGGRQTYTYTRTDDAGFSQTLTVSIGSVVLGNDAARVASEWKAVGGTGQNPCYDVQMWAGRIMEHELAGYAFGTVTITNDRPDFPAQPWGYQFTRSGSFSMMGLQFSNGGSCQKLYEGGYVMQPSWGGDATWGPVPLVIAIADVRSPGAPQGDPNVVSADVVSLYPTAFSFPLTLAG